MCFGITFIIGCKVDELQKASAKTFDTSVYIFWKRLAALMYQVASLVL